MTQWSVCVCLCLGAVVATAPAGSGAAIAQPAPPSISYELAIDGLSEKVTLPLESWSWGAVDEYEAETTLDGKTRKPRGLIVQDFHIVVEQTTASALLLEALASRKTMSKATVRAKGGDAVFEMVMKDVKVSSFHTGGYGKGGSLPMEQVSMTFKSAKLTVGPKGKTESVEVTNPR